MSAQHARQPRPIPQFEACAEELRRQVTKPAEGVYGRDSVAWQVNRELSVFLFGAQAALMQLAHPKVAHAVEQHSYSRRDPRTRFSRTFSWVYPMVFSELEQAIALGRRVYTIHERIYGDIDEARSYRANDQDALLWVWATLIHGGVQAYELVVRKLTEAELEEHMAQSRHFGLLCGVADETMPTTWRELDDYVRRMCETTLEVTPPARAMCDVLFAARDPMWLTYKAVTGVLLPDGVREGYGFRAGPVERAVFNAAIPALRVGRLLVPPRYRYIPIYHRTVQRLDGTVSSAGRDALSRWIESGVLGLTTNHEQLRDPKA